MVLSVVAWDKIDSGRRKRSQPLGRKELSLDEMSCVGRWRGSREEDFVGASQPLSTSLSAKQRLVMKDRASCADNPEVVCVSSANGS